MSGDSGGNGAWNCLTDGARSSERRQSDYCVSVAEMKRQRQQQQDVNLGRHNSIERSQDVSLSRRQDPGFKLGPLQFHFNSEMDYDGQQGITVTWIERICICFIFRM